MSFKKIILYIAGFTTLGLALLGIFLPVLPTTPFLILSLTCFASCNKTMYNKVVKIKYFNEFIDNYQNETGVPVKTKIRAIIFLWLGLIVSCFIVNKAVVIAILILIGIGVTIHISSLKTKVNA